ncbi:MAG TPA: glycosyltransferase [Gemmatimonadota bacterium]|nr:glycosyltransferase [Gemmatimonadota bacterium]
MRVAVLSLTRDRLEYTQHTFAKLREFAGCEFDHYVLDQGSTDGTREWLEDEYEPVVLLAKGTNVGISPGMNELLRYAVDLPDPFDVIVKFDNDCELTQPNTLRDVARLALEGGCLLSPRILGLQNPPQPTRELQINGEVILDVPQIGGIFLAAPAWVYDEFRYSESNPTYGGDDVEICAWFRSHGGTCGYVKRLEAWHYETTDGQRERFPDYFDRKLAEMAA